MNNKLITALRTSANSIENGTFTYAWTDPSRCNCGVLACALLGESPRAINLVLHDMPKDGDGNATWTHYASTTCPITGIPEHKIFKELFSYGLTQADFHHLEYLTNPDIRARMVMPKVLTSPTLLQWIFGQPGHEITEPINYKNGLHVALYMRAWADLLTERGQLDAPEKQAAQAREGLAQFRKGLAS